MARDRPKGHEGINMSENSARAAIWDMDGTLVDTAELHFAAWEAVCRELGRPFTRADFTATFGRRNPEIVRWLFGDGRFNDKEIADLGDRKEERYRAAARSQGVVPLPGVVNLLEGLKRAGFRQAIGSSAPRANLDLILEMTGLTHYFQAVAAMEDTQRGKPDPQVFLVAADRLGVSPARSVVFEDAVAGVEAAKAGGMKCVAVSFVGHHSEEKLREAGADLVVSNLDKVSAVDVQRLFGPD
jgi:beta-phosphoglucomutase